MGLALAENRRTATKARIKRATAAAHRDMRRLDREALAALERQYRAAAADVQAAIQARAGGDGNVHLDALRDLLDQVQARLKQLTTARNALLGQNLNAAALLGVKPFDAVAVGASLTRVAAEAAQFVQRFVGADGLQLSDRLWRLDKQARESVSDAIQQAVIKGYGASQAAQDFLRRGNPVPSDVIADINAANAGGLARTAGAALLKDEAGALVNARRVFRTEINRAHGEAYFKSSENDPDVAGFRFLLSPNHPRADICDMHASVNLYGLGPGVYPDRASCPWPAHPNTLSFVEVVFVDEITDEDRQGKDPGRIAWIRAQPVHRQTAVLGGARKQAALASGVLRENEIGTPWKVLKAKYEKRGVDVASFAPPAAPVPLLTPGPPTTMTPAGTPVSQALKAVEFKAVAARTLAAIDAVHGDGVLPNILIRRGAATMTAEGTYKYVENHALRIELRSDGIHPEMTLAHEIGHFIDHEGLPGPGWSSAKAKFMTDWRDTVRATPAVQALHALASGPDKIVVQGKKYGVHKNHLAYLLEWEELWARSYAQYIAIRSGDAVMLEQLNATLERQRAAQVDYRRQWEREEFAPVADAIDDIMRSMGWA